MTQVNLYNDRAAAADNAKALSNVPGASITNSRILRRRSVKNTLRSLLIVCLTLFFVGASSLRPAYAQSPLPFVPVFPKYIVMGVVYAPPGSESYVTYGGSNLVGSTNTISTTNSSTFVDTRSFTAGGFLGLFGGSTTSSTSDGWTTTSENSSSVAVQTTMGNAISTMGPISSSLGVNHDNDIIYILLNPALSTYVSSYNHTTGALNILSWSGLASNGCDLTNPIDDPVTFYQVVSGCDPNQYPFPDVVGIPVWCLKNPYYPGQSCAQWIPYTSRSWDLSTWLPIPTSGGPLPPGLTYQDYADILQADPFVALNGTAVNVCHVTYGPNLNPNDSEVIQAPQTPAGRLNYTGNTAKSCGANGTRVSRFQPYGTVEYPDPGPNGLPSTYTGNFQYSQTTTAGTTVSDTHTVGYSSNRTISFGTSFGLFGFPIAGFDIAMSSGTNNSMTWQHQSGFVSTNGNTSTASYSITGPQLSDNYTGPATYNVYLDNVYGTYAFYSDLAPDVTLGNIDISPTTITFPQVTVGTSSAAQQITLTNHSAYQLTMVGPAVTFSDPGFTIVNDGNDRCSNQLLSPYGSTQGSYTCTLNVKFSPVVSDAPNTIYGTTYPVNATMIAAGTENALPYQNILVANPAPISGTAAVGTTTQGATLFPNPIQNTSQKNAFVFPAASSPPTAQTQQFKFTNYYSPSVTFPSSGDLLSTNTTDFTILSDLCAGATITAGSSCTFTVQYLPGPTIPPGGLFSTGIRAFGRVGSSLTITQLALAGAAGTVVGYIAIGGSPSLYIQTAAIGCTIYCPPTTGNTGPLTIYNGTSFTLTNITYSSTGGFGFGGCSTLSAGQTCSATISYSPSPNYNGTYTYNGTITVNGTEQTTGSPHVSATETATATVVYVGGNSPTIALTGAEQSKTTVVPATNAKGSVTVNPLLVPATRNGSVSIAVGNFNASALYSAGAGTDAVAKAIVASLNVAGSPVKAARSGSIVTVKSINAGTSGNMSLQTSGDTNFAIVPSGTALTGGKDGTTKTVYDSGSVDVTTGGLNISIKWGSASTPHSIATAVAKSINAMAGAYWKATVYGDAVGLTSVSQTPPSLDVTVKDTKGFSPTSFDAIFTY